jgi:hypothetical protein
VSHPVAPTGNVCDQFEPRRRPRPAQPSNVSQQFAPTGNPFDGFRRWRRVILVLGIPLAVLAALRGLWSP